MTNWISVKDKLPDEKMIILVINKEKEMAVCEININENNYIFMLFNTSLQIKHVTHWTPLPDPPEIEKPSCPG